VFVGFREGGQKVGFSLPPFPFFICCLGNECVVDMLYCEIVSLMNMPQEDGRTNVSPEIVDTQIIRAKTQALIYTQSPLRSTVG
jgi:hypothetical protein